MSCFLTYIRRYLLKVLKKNRFCFNKIELLRNYKLYKRNIKESRSFVLKSHNKIKSEVALIKKYWNCGDFHYYRYELYNKLLSEDQLLEYVPLFYYHKAIEKKHKSIDTIKYGDKLVQAKLFKNRGINSSQVIAVLKNEIATDLYRNNLDLFRVLRNHFNSGVNKIFFKPINGAGGFGIVILKNIHGNYFVNEKQLKAIEEVKNYLSKTHTYIIQDNIEQSEQMMQINSSSVNTLRVVVQKFKNQMFIRTCILRMGRSGRDVDNSAQGGISININANDGKINDFATAEHGGGVIFEHPDSKFVFKGQYINNWSIIKKQILSIANKLKDFNDIALDIAVTDKGTLLIEFNFRYGIEHQQCVYGGIRKILGFDK